MYRLLIADGSAAVRESICGLLDWQALGFELLEQAERFEQAVDMAVELDPHMALVDVRLGGQWGYDLVRQARAFGLGTVFCMLAEENDAELIRRCMQAGARDYLLKPVDPVQLRSFIERTLSDGEGGLSDGGAAGGVDPILHVEYARLSRLTNKMLMVVHSGYRYPQSLTTIAEGLHMNSKYLGRVFLHETGMKLSEYLLAYRMEQARKLIVNTREKISAVASMVGYSQLNRFYVHFRNYFGLSPGDLRSAPAGGSGEEEQKHDTAQ